MPLHEIAPPSATSPSSPAITIGSPELALSLSPSSVAAGSVSLEFASFDGSVELDELLLPPPHAASSMLQTASTSARTTMKGNPACWPAPAGHLVLHLNLLSEVAHRVPPRRWQREPRTCEFGRPGKLVAALSSVSNPRAARAALGCDAAGGRATFGRGAAADRRRPATGREERATDEEHDVDDAADDEVDLRPRPDRPLAQPRHHLRRRRLEHHPDLRRGRRARRPTGRRPRTARGRRR